MDRHSFHRLFKCAGPAVTPVIHVLDQEQTERNVALAARLGAAGVFLINHDFEAARLVPILAETRRRWPGLWLGANFLGVSGAEAFPILGRLEAEGRPIDAYWADDARIDERVEAQAEADEIAAIRARSGWSGLYFGGVAFKKQRPVAPEKNRHSAEIASRYMDVVTTSGVATGEAADAAKIADFRAGLGDRPLALASGVTPGNADRYADQVDCFLVATGVAPPGDFYNIDPGRLDELLSVTRRVGAAPVGDLIF